MELSDSPERHDREYGSTEPFPKGRKITFFRPLTATHDRRHDDPQHVTEHAKSYVRAVKNFSKYFRRSPDQLTFEQVRAYRLHLGSRGLGVQAINQIISQSSDLAAIGVTTDMSPAS